jgi:hypothetical protein
MTNKVKSLIYLSCFILSAVFYQMTVSGSTNDQLKEQQQLVEADMTIQPFTENTVQTVTH